MNKGRTTALGHWREPLMNLQAGVALVWQAPGPTGLRVWTGLFDGKPVARISRQPGHGKGCSAALDGWVWTDQLPGTSASQIGVKVSSTRGFTSVPEAKQAIKAALAAAQI